MKKHFFQIASCMIMFSALFSCGQQTKKQTQINEQTKIVSLSGTVTEVLCALGFEKHIAGVDVTSNYPSSVTQLPQVGFARTVSAENILALSPTLIIGFKDGLKPELAEQVTAAHAGTMAFDPIYSLEGSKAFIRQMADSFGQEAKGNALVKQIDEDLKGVKPLSRKPKVLFIYARGAGTLLVAGQHTALNSMIELAGGENAAQGFDDFKPLTPEALVSFNPDVILMFDMGVESLGGIDGLLKIPGVDQTNAGKNRQVIEMEGQYLAGFGPRTGKAAADLNQKLAEVRFTDLSAKK